MAWLNDSRGLESGTSSPSRGREAVDCKQSSGKDKMAENELKLHLAVSMKWSGMLRRMRSGAGERLLSLFLGAEQQNPNLPKAALVTLPRALPTSPAVLRKIKSLAWGNLPGIVPIKWERGKEYSPSFLFLSPTSFCFYKRTQIKVLWKGCY